ncbi:MAG: hypothetical protein ABW096_11745 [Candidatus Thiodiazotropha sp.]
MKLTLFLIIVAVIFIIAWYFESQRREGLGRVAQRIGFKLETGQHRLPQTLDSAGFYLFTQGEPLIQNMMDGARNSDRLLLFNYTYVATEGFEGRREIPSVTDEGTILTHMQTVVAFIDIDPLPHFDLSPNDNSKRTLPGDFRPVGFDDAGEFTRHYRLAGREEAKVRALFNEQLLAHFARNPGWVVESRGDQLILYRPDERIKPEEMVVFIDQAHYLLDNLRLHLQR